MSGSELVSSTFSRVKPATDPVRIFEAGKDPSPWEEDSGEAVESADAVTGGEFVAELDVFGSWGVDCWALEAGPAGAVLEQALRPKRMAAAEVAAIAGRRRGIEDSLGHLHVRPSCHVDGPWCLHDLPRAGRAGTGQGHGVSR